MPTASVRMIPRRDIAFTTWVARALSPPKVSVIGVFHAWAAGRKLTAATSGQLSAVRSMGA